MMNKKTTFENPGRGKRPARGLAGAKKKGEERRIA